jgi:hypothetical protein
MVLVGNATMFILPCGQGVLFGEKIPIFSEKEMLLSYLFANN